MFFNLAIIDFMRLPDPETLGRNITRLRKQHRWSQRDLAKKLNVHQTLIYRWEKGTGSPRAEMIPILAEVLEAAVNELTTTSEPEKSTSTPLPFNDPELGRLVGLISSFEERDREALKIFIEAIATKNRVQAAMQLGDSSSSLVQKRAG